MQRARDVAARRSTALGIPCPATGDENDPLPRTYPAWFWLYKTTRKLRHHIGLHDWQYAPAIDGSYCTWCGKHAV